MDTISEIASHIIKEQQSIIGPLSLDQARKVVGLNIDNLNDITIQGDPREVLTNLVNQYAKLFGQASIEVCKEAFRPYASKLQPAEIPEVLRV